MEESPKFERQDLPPTASLSVDLVARIIQSRRSLELPGEDVIRTLEVEGQIASKQRYLGSGGSKEVFDVEIDGGEHFAVALCGLQDTPDRVIQKWENVLKEPANTAKLKSRGFYVNDLCEIKNTKVNGIEFPVLVMRRFEDHPFQIFDSKNIGKNANPLFDEKIELSDDKMMALMSSVSDEIVRLVREGIRLGRDNFNLCVSEGKMHLYFNDLGASRIEPYTEDEKERVIDQYVLYAVGAVVSSVSEATYQNNTYIRQMGNTGNTLETRLKKQISEQLGIKEQ